MSFAWSRRPAVILVVALGLLLRLWAAWQLPLDYDEPVYVNAAFDYARLIRSGDLAGIIDYPENPEHPPLVKLLYGLAILALGPGADFESGLFASRLVSVFFGTLAVLVLALCQPLAGGLLAVQTLVVKYTAQAYLEALPLFASILAVVLLASSKGRRDGRFWLSAAAFGLALAGKYSYFPILFVLLFLLIWQKKTSWAMVLLYLGVSGLAFLAFDPALWRDPANRLVDSALFHTRYSQNLHVRTSGYPWYQPFLWVSSSFGFTWHPDVFFYFGFDALIALLGLAGLRTDMKRRPWVVVWVLAGMAFLLLWPTKWPQYALVVLPAFCLAASTAIPEVLEWLREQEDYWNWFREMLPETTPLIRAVLIGLLLLVTVGSVVGAVVEAVDRIGWSRMQAGFTPLPDNTVYAIQPLPGNRMLLGTGSGATVWHPAGEGEILDEWEIFTTENSPLPGNQVLEVLSDEAGGFWLGTSSGLARFADGEWQVFRSGDYGLEGGRVRAMELDSSGRLWIGTEAGAAVYDGQTWTAYTTENSSLGEDFIFSIAVEPLPAGDRIWFGGPNTLSRLDTAAEAWENWYSSTLGLGPGGNADLLVDSEGRLWVANLGGGLSVLEGDDWTHFRTANSDIPYNTVRRVAEISPGEFWVASSFPNESGGVVSRLVGESWTTYYPGRSGYSGAETVAIARGPLGRIWFGTLTAGVDLYQPED